MSGFADKVAIVTGAGSGIGRAAAMKLASLGAHVVVADVKGYDETADAIRAAGGYAFASETDVRLADNIKTLIEQTHKTFGRLDLAFNNAGIAQTKRLPLTEIDEDIWSNIMDTNLRSVFLCMKYQIPAMQKRGGGSLIFTSTFVGYTVGFPGVATYAASKSGLIGLTQALAVEFALANIRVNAILPGGTDTAMYREMNSTPEAQAFIVSLYPARRLATADEMAKSVLYLASDASSFTTGAIVRCDGGQS